MCTMMHRRRNWMPFARCVSGAYVPDSRFLPSKTPSTNLVFTLFFYHFSMPTHFAYPTMIPMRHGNAAGLIGQTPSHATYVLPSGSSMMHGSESRAPSNGGANSSQNSSHRTRSRSRLRQGRCECAPILFFPCRHVCTIRGASLSFLLLCSDVMLRLTVS